MTETLTEDIIAERLAELRNVQYKYVKPFSSTYGGILDSLASSDHRFKLGIAPIDTLVRGFGPKELVFVTGFAHSGKTQLVNTAILNNLDKRVLFFSMDDPAEMILLKLTCMWAQIPADELERLIHNNDENAKATLKRAATEVFSNLIVVDDSLGLGQMDKAIAEATHLWGQPPDLVVLDYLELMQGNAVSDDASANVKSKSQALKKWVKSKDWPTMVLHQGTRSNSKPGAPITMTSMAYGGEQEGTVVIGVRRKKDDRELDSWQRATHETTVTLHVVKNKRPPAKVTKPDGVDLFMDPATGVIRTLVSGDMHTPGVPVHEVRTTSVTELQAKVDEARQKVESLSG